MTQEVLQIERSIKERREWDVKLTNYWLTMLILAPITLGIYPLVLFFKQIIRVDKFIQRKRKYYSEVINYTEKYLKENNYFDEYQHKFNELKNSYNDIFLRECKELNILLALLLSFVTLGIYGIYFNYRLNRIWDDLQKFEEEFYDKLNSIWIKVNIIKYPINFRYDSSKKRSFIVNILLTVVSFGLWSIVWQYKLWTDPDNLYSEFHTAEDTVLNAIRK